MTLGRRVTIDKSGADDLPPIDPSAEVDCEALVRRTLNIINHEVKRLEMKSNAMILDLQESKLLESYLRAILAADERLSSGKGKLSEDDTSKLGPEELRNLLGIIENPKGES